MIVSFRLSVSGEENSESLQVMLLLLKSRETLCAVAVDVNTLSVTLMSLSVKMTAMGVTCDNWLDGRYKWLSFSLTLHASLPVSVTQVKTT